MSSSAVLAGLKKALAAYGLSLQLPDWLVFTDAQKERAARLVLSREAECLSPYPLKAGEAHLQLAYIRPSGERSGKLYVDGAGQVFGRGYTWAEARRKPRLLVYRDCEIQPSDLRGAEAWSWCHKSYDGPPDDRCGYAATPAEARKQIAQLDTNPGSTQTMERTEPACPAKTAAP